MTNRQVLTLCASTWQLVGSKRSFSTGALCQDQTHGGAVICSDQLRVKGKEGTKGEDR